ncbi:Uncharacterised protein r2_g650 [Pycnogonum litorale]
MASDIQLVVNEVLYFVTNYLRKVNDDVLREIVINFYKEEELDSAREELIGALTDNLEEIGCASLIRSRRQQPAGKYFEDIIQLLTKSSEKKLKLPLFCSNDISKVPSVDPTKLNAVSILESIKNLQYDVKLLKSERNLNIGKSRKLNMPIRDKLFENEIQGDDNNNNKNKSFSETVINAQINERSMPILTPIQMKIFNNSQSDCYGIDNDGFTKVKNSRRKSKLIRGTQSSDTCFLSGVPPKVDICIKRLSNETTTENVLTHLKNIAVKAENVELLKSSKLISDEYVPRFKSFKITVLSTDLAKIYNENNWPYFVIIKPFYKIKNDTQSGPNRKPGTSGNAT